MVAEGCTKLHSILLTYVGMAVSRLKLCRAVWVGTGLFPVAGMQWLATRFSPSHTCASLYNPV